MPIEFLGTVLLEGTHRIPYWEQIKTYSPPLLAATLLKFYFGGSANTWERKLHGKVFIVTGGTSGIGAALVKELASQGAQIVLLTSQIGNEETNDVKEDDNMITNSGRLWISEYVENLREITGNQMIYAEFCDLGDLYSIRKFATKWLDNKPARRLDGVLCLAGESLPVGKLRTNSVDGVEIQMAINYLGHFHLLTLLEPALKVQPPDRDVRVILSSCLTQAFGDIKMNDLLWDERNYPNNKPWKIYGTSKLMLNMFSKEFQRRLDAYERPDKQPCGIRVNVVNPGIVRTPSTRRFLSMGSIIGLFFYIIFYPLYWLLLKSCEQGMQSYLFAVNCPNLFNIRGGNYIKECSLIKEIKTELVDAELQKKLYEATIEKISSLEKRSALERNRQRKKLKKQSPDVQPETEQESASTSAYDRNLGIFTSAFTNDMPLYPESSSKL